MQQTTIAPEIQAMQLKFQENVTILINEKKPFANVSNPTAKEIM